MKTLLIGLGVSGKAAAELLLAKGKELVAVDSRQQVVAEEKRFPSYLEGVSVDFQEIDQVVVSPGVSRAHPLYREAIRRGIEVIGEAELAFRYISQPAIGVTGTNGKTTVVLLIEHLLRCAGIPARALGNSGEPLAQYALKPNPEETLVVELSSFQLETAATPLFDAGLVLNITPDHLDRYDSLDQYAEAKGRLACCLKPEVHLFVSRQIMQSFPALFSSFSIRCFDEPELFETILPPAYQTQSLLDKANALAAWAIVSRLGISHRDFCEGVKSFKKPPHRIEFVAEIDGVAYYDDSKGTNVDAVLRAVEAMPDKVVLIAGGVDKGGGYAPWRATFGKKVKRMVVMGESAEKIAEELQGCLPIERAASLEEAVQLAAANAASGESVLLSPGCSSFDMFRDYKQRGNEFKRHVLDLQERRKKNEP